jgi:hypothetical protein
VSVVNFHGSIFDLHEHPPDQRDEHDDKNDDEHKVVEMDGGDHFSPVMAVMAVAAPAAPMAIPSPEIVVVLVIVPSGEVVSTT